MFYKPFLRPSEKNGTHRVMRHKKPNQMSHVKSNIPAISREKFITKY